MATTIEEFISAVAEDETAEDDDSNVTLIPITEMEPDPDNPGKQRVRAKVTLRAYDPGSGQLGYLLATNGRHNSDEEKVAGVVNFFNAVLDDDDQIYIQNRLLDRRDPFGLDEINDLMEKLVEAWGGRPPKQPTDFAGSQQNGGRKSKPRTRQLTSSGAPSESSST